MNDLKTLQIDSHNSGVSSPNNAWHKNLKKEIEVINPANENVIASVGVASNKELDGVIDLAQKGFLTWREVPAPKRGELVRVIAQKLREKKKELGALVAMETGKLRQEGEGEVQEMIDIADFAVGLSRMLYGHTMPSERVQHHMYEQWHPFGVVGVITAFNFPVAVWAWNAFIALVCGNTVVWKPSPKTPLSAIAVMHICHDAMNELKFWDVLSLVVTDDNACVEQLVGDKRVPLISFTGSTAVGQHINQIVAKRLGRTILELSGNNAVILDETADLDLAIPAIVFGAVGTTGQRCTTTRRVFIHRNLYRNVVDALIKAYQQVVIGDPLKVGTLMGPLIDANAVKHYQTTIKEIECLGGEILYGGHMLEGPGYFVQPTLATAKPDWDVVMRETFAPIVYLMPFETLEEAILMQNNVPQGLSSALFTQHVQHMHRFLSVSGSDCGLANVNLGTSGAEIGGAFGGEKATGGGREAGSDAWKAYMRRQTVTINWGHTLPLAQGIRFNIIKK